MPLELTEQQRLLVEERAGQPVEVVDPHSQRSYVLIAREQFDKVRSLLERRKIVAPPSADVVAIVPIGIRLSQEAMRRDLPELLKQKKLHCQWIAYHRNERIGIARDKISLMCMCLQRGLDDDEFYVGIICQLSLIEEEELDPPAPWFMVDKEPDR